MALDATVGGATANSYVTVAEASAYFANRLHGDAWSASTNQYEAEALITASQQLDWYITWKGTKASVTQALDWPRTGVLDDLGVDEYASTVLPAKLKVAVFELALSSLATDRTNDPSLAGISEIRAGSLQIKADDGVYTSTPSAIPDKVRKILKGLSVRSGNSVRLIRA